MEASPCFLERKLRTFLLIFLVVSMAIAFPTLYVFNRTKSMLIEETQSKAKDIAISIASFLTSDIERYRALSEAENLVDGSPEHLYYLQLLDVIRSIKVQADADFVFTAKMIDEQTSAYVLDGEDPQSELFSPFGSIDGMNPTELMVYQVRTPLASGVELDPYWGAFLTGYAPIIDYRDDQVIGLVGADFSADFLHMRYVRIAWIIFICFALLDFFITALLYLIIQVVQNRANIDELTSLGSKRYFKRFIACLLKETHKTNRPFVLMMLDMDAFKAINDVHGHLLGDRVLYLIAQALIHVTSSKNSCFRYGGDEFAILLADTTLEKAERVRKQLIAKVKAIAIEELDEPLSISIGMAQADQESTPETIIHEADTDLYEQKRANHEARQFSKEKKPIT